LVIGVNKYQYVGPLVHACNDAQAVADILVKRFAFSKANIDLLIDQNATRESILRTFLRYADIAEIKPNDRVLVFFAGHGHTVSGRYGEIGYLVPVDGKVDDLSTLIRWDDLTRNADLIPAKHMLFLMDACYGGLALTRTTIPPGSMRFLKDMLQRYARPVLTAGKGDETVSDSGGTRRGHSIFTSHLLDGMEGAAAPSGGILTGHGLMAYVYDKVGSDPQSRQTPHFGFFDGDGDFIFDTSALAKLRSAPSSEPEPDLDVFITAPAFAAPLQQQETIADVLKRLIASPSEKIRLNDFILARLRNAAERLSQDKFPLSGIPTNDEFASRIQRYEDAVADLVIAVILLAHHAEAKQVALLENIFARLAEFEKGQAGSVLWIRLAWYPVLVLMYAAGISALAANRFDALRAALLTPVYTPRPLLDQDMSPVVLPVILELTDIVEDFKRLPDMERKYVPRSEHLYKKLQPVLEDQLFLGRRYEVLFDQFEILLALTFADLRDDDPAQGVWGPPGRFAWKERRHPGVFTDFVNQAKSQGDDWGALTAGFFRRSSERFAAVADAYKQLIAKIPWW
jgi:Caspase domain